MTRRLALQPSKSFYSLGGRLIYMAWLRLAYLEAGFVFFRDIFIRFVISCVF